MERELTSSIRIQTAYRGYEARRFCAQKTKVASLFDASSTVGHEQYDAAVLIQRHVRGSNVRENLLRNASAQVIQTQMARILSSSGLSRISSSGSNSDSVSNEEVLFGLQTLSSRTTNPVEVAMLSRLMCLY